MDDESDTPYLPLDILIALMDYVHPLDLIAFQKTCKALYYAGQQTYVWIRAVTDLNLANDAFLPAFELDQLTTQELAKVATAPTRWLATMRKRCRRQQEQPHLDLSWKPSRINPAPIELGLEEEDEVQAIYLVPGGRFTLILTMYTLQIWDLGLVGKDNVAARRVTSVSMAEQVNVAFSAQPTKDNLGLRMVVSSMIADADRQHISIYETFLLEDQPTLNRIGEANVEVLIDSLDAGIAARLAGDVVYILQDRFISAWDFVNGQWARWYTQKHISLDIFMTPDSIVFLDHEEMVIWKMPDVRSLSQQPSVVAENVDHRILSPSSLAGVGGIVSEAVIDFCSRLCDWYWNKQQIVVGIYPPVKPYVISHFKLSPDLWSSVSTDRALCEQTVYLDAPVTPDAATLYRLCEDSLVACYRSVGTDLAVSVRRQVPESLVYLRMRMQHPMNYVKEYSFCPVSGRICYVTYENELEVADLFASTECSHRVV